MYTWITQQPITDQVPQKLSTQVLRILNQHWMKEKKSNSKLQGITSNPQKIQVELHHFLYWNRETILKEFGKYTDDSDLC